jgi:hypothetical protein
MIAIQLEPEVEARLTAEAQARGLALDRYIVEKLSESHPAGQTRQPSVGDSIDGIRALRKGNRLNGLTIKQLIEDGRKY